MIRTRFAPSPTGFLHVGGLRTALYAYLFAKKNNGDFILRIEDTDQSRQVHGALENLINTLNTFGVTYTEGATIENNKVVQKGDYGPYIQSERKDTYKKYAEELVNNGKAYHCFCSSERLTKLREKQQQLKQPPRYDKKCLKLTKVEIKEKLTNNEPHVVRLNIEPGKEIVFYDIVREKISVQSGELDDQVLLKSDGFATYHLANVVDDHLMKITHVIRGEEWVPSTPKHVLLYEAFGWKAPKFAHLPLLLNPDKTKLSKRQGDVAAEDFLKKGYTKEAILNFIAFLGWNPKNEKEIFTLEELRKDFVLKNVQKAGAVFNREKLDWMNKQHIKRMDNEQFFSAAQPFLKNFMSEDQEKVKKACILEKERVTTYSELEDAIAFFFEDIQYSKDLLAWKKLTVKQAQENLKTIKELISEISTDSFNKEELNNKIYAHIKENNLKIGEMLWPLRVAVSGKEKSPGPYEIMEILEKEEVIRRIDQAINL